MLDERSIQVDDREILLVGTRVVTPESIARLGNRVREFGPDSVVLDYDESRWRWLGLLQGETESDVNLVDVIKSGEMVELNARLAMGVLAKYVAPRAGVPVDAEFVHAHAVATELEASLVFGRRPVGIEGLRAWRECSAGERFGFAWNLFKGSLRRSQLADPDAAAEKFDPEIARNRGMTCAAGAAPVLFDEAERWLAGRALQAEGRTVVVTHSSAMAQLEQALHEAADVSGLDVVKEKTLLSRIIPWAFSFAIIAAFILGFIFADPEKMEQAAYAWFGANMILSALGAACALAHPVTIIATSISSPFVSLNPAIGAGMVGALVQAFVAPPSVKDMDSVGDDITQISGWWRNRLARLVLIFVFGNVFSSIGSFAALAWFPTS